MLGALLVIALAAILVGLVLFLFYADGDLTLLFTEKYGLPINVLSRKVIWITGASSGIGEYLAYELANYRVKLILSGTNEKRLDNVMEQCIKRGLSKEDILVLPFDISQTEVHEDCVNRVLAKFNKLDVLVNNAGRSQRANFEDTDIEVDKQLFDINVFGTINLTRKVLPHFLQHRAGHLVVTSSCAGKIGVPNSASYTGSKHALHGYFECLRTEMSQKGINVTMACPGPVFSGFLEKAFTDVPGEVFGGKHQQNDKRMPTARCSHLMAVAIANQLDEAWISIQPCLSLYYLAQYTPSIFRDLFVKKCYSPERATAFREGKW